VAERGGFELPSTGHFGCIKFGGKEKETEPFRARSLISRRDATSLPWPFSPVRPIHNVC
jgi:hypothetical protein